MQEIKKTNNYDLFRHIKSNRSINKAHVDKIVKSIQEKNLLSCTPILVNEDMNIIDGQHRLAAAKLLGVDVYYQIMKNSNVKDLVLLNTSKNWLIVDFLNYYVDQKFPEYLKLKEFSERVNLQYRIAIPLCSGTFRKDYQDFREGKYKFDERFMHENMNVCKETIEFIKKYNGASHYVSGARFWKALVSIVSNPGFDKKVWFRNLERFVGRFRKMIGEKEYHKFFLEIYNWRTKNKLMSFENPKQEEDNDE
jgi:hypothetical protein